ncbi:MAG: 2,3-bisphosphoglycerate-independent phosphoglycerate mutase [Anaerovoracaceae bacterium]
MKKLFMLMILDGFGIAPAGPGNAVVKAYKPNLDEIFSKYPHTQLKASGLAVGLPEGQMGNSEVGHLNIGAGRVVYQELTRISKAIDDGVFAGNAALNDAINHCRETGGALHVMGLLSDGGVHSHISHIKAVVSLAFSHNVSPIYVHCFMDGRDVPPTSGINYIKEMENFLSDIDGASTGVVAGRYYAMDRDKRWERVKLAYDALVSGQGRRASSGSQAVAMAYEAGETDEFILPTVCSDKARVKDGDSIIFCNFRPDRARELTRCFVDDDFSGFERPRKIADLKYVCMTQYDETMPNVEIAFPPAVISNTLGEYLSSLGMSQLRIAETEKYAHVTFFFNGGVEKPNPLEDRILIPSPKVATYDLQPEMSAFEVTEKVIEEIKSSKYDCIILNFANPDMVGHTGKFDAAVKAIEAIDQCVGKIVPVILEAGGQILLTADHGNADDMLDSSGNPVTAHSLNPVPLVHIAETPVSSLAGGGRLCDIAPTMLKLMGLSIPPEMTGKPLI